MKEDKKEICNKLCELLRMTRNFGDDRYNSLKELRYVVNGSEEFVVPIFKDGTGEPNEHFPNGYYAVNVTADSGVSLILDVMKKFVDRR